LIFFSLANSSGDIQDGLAQNVGPKQRLKSRGTWSSVPQDITQQLSPAAAFSAYGPAHMTFPNRSYFSEHVETSCPLLPDMMLQRGGSLGMSDVAS
jgi:hypothetical protein